MQEEAETERDDFIIQKTMWQKINLTPKKRIQAKSFRAKYFETR